MQKQVIRAVRAAMDFGFFLTEVAGEPLIPDAMFEGREGLASGQSTIWFFLIKNLVQSFLADSPGCWMMWLRSSASGGRTYVPWKLSRKASSKSSQLPMEFSGRLFSQCRAGPFNFSGRYLMAWRSSPWAIWIGRIKSSIHTVGSVVPSYDSIFTGLNPSGNSYSTTSSVKQRGCAVPLYRARSRRSSHGVRWYVSVVSIIFYCSMPIFYNFHILLATFYTIFGTNILIWCPSSAIWSVLT